MAQQLYQPEVLEEIKSIELLSSKWLIKILGALSRNCMRFSELQHGLGISSKTLSARLKEMEREGLVTRTLYAQVPLRVEYELTEKGEELLGIVSEFSTWEKKWK
jgi:DNA-binding HxlR family transcriptional regulator